MPDFHELLQKYREEALSQRDKGGKFEALMQRYLLTDRKYSFTKVWLWGEFPHRADFGGADIGIDLVALDDKGAYWAVQCKFYEETTPIQKSHVDSFLSASGKSFATDANPHTKFAHRIWISTGGNWSSHAEEALHNQDPPVTRLNASDLENSGVDWEKLDSGLSGKKALSEKKHLRDYQEKAVSDTLSHFQTHDRGKLIMACGTGKTFTSLRIAEAWTAEAPSTQDVKSEAESQSGTGGLVLFLVPSIALLGQTLNEWSAQSEKPLKALCICSDAEVSKKKSKNDDSTFSTIDLALPATTHVPAITRRLEEALDASEGMAVVFCTYQSIEVVSKAQKELAKTRDASFSLIICDEAHRTTGVTLADEDESEFVRVHDNTFIQAKKRLYMTATPRLYDDNAKVKAGQINAVLCSMDDEKIYGEEIYRIGFGEAVEKNMLSDYKVLILTLSEASMPASLQNLIAGHESSLNADDASKLVGCINGLSKRILGDGGILAEADPEPMRRCVAFCSSIKSSKEITGIFNHTAPAYYEGLEPERRKALVKVSSQHIDGTMNASRRDGLLQWLKAETPAQECHMLTNVRCLSEGVDVPSLDAVLFLSARNSQVDVVQSVGRVMRRAEGKKYGYIIIPILVPSNVAPEQALADNSRYKVVWTVLNALRAHDDRFNAVINKIELNKKRDGRILIGSVGEDSDSGAPASDKPAQLNIPFAEYQNAIYAKMVQKVGDRGYWENWARGIAEIAERHVERITRLVQGGLHKEAFDSFLAGLHKNINPNIEGAAAIEMLGQHLITRPVFEALFEGYSFAKNNPMLDKIFPDNFARLDKQKNSPITVIMGNPPYSIGQKSENDNAQNDSHPKLEGRIAQSYAKNSSAGLNKSTYNSYIKAFRWATDRLSSNGGLVAYITDGGWLDGNASDGFRKCLEEEFSHIYVFNLRGNANTSGDIRKKEAGGVFGEESKTSIAITLLVKTPSHQGKAQIFYRDIGDYLSRKDKLAILASTPHVDEEHWQKLSPNEHGDWLSQRGEAFAQYTPLTPAKKFAQDSQSFFIAQAVGTATGRDPYVYGFSQHLVGKNMKAMIKAYNSRVELFKTGKHPLDSIIADGSAEVKWTRSLKNQLSIGRTHKYSEGKFVQSTYRPFCKMHLYKDDAWIESPGLSYKLFPTPTHKNVVICIEGLGTAKTFTNFVTDSTPDYQLMGNCQYFPLYYYEEAKKDEMHLYESQEGYVRKSGLSPYIMAQAKNLYGKVTEEDVFYYVYGVLHSPSYRQKYAADLKRMLPHLPLLPKEQFFAFSKAGRKLADLHLEYESQKPLAAVSVVGDTGDYAVQKMRFAKAEKAIGQAEAASKEDKSRILYNGTISVENIPAQAYRYVVNGRPAIEWVMERYQLKTDKDSGITNDPNLWASENGLPRYALDLLLSLKSVAIIEGLPAVEWE